MSIPQNTTCQVTEEFLVLPQSIQFFLTACHDFTTKILWTQAPVLPVNVFDNQIAEVVVIDKFMWLDACPSPSVSNRIKQLHPSPPCSSIDCPRLTDIRPVVTSALDILRSLPSKGWQGEEVIRNPASTYRICAGRRKPHSGTPPLAKLLHAKIPASRQLAYWPHFLARTAIQFC